MQRLTQNVHLNEPGSLKAYVIGGVAHERSRLVSCHFVNDEFPVIRLDTVEAEVPGVGAGRGANCRAFHSELLPFRDVVDIACWFDFDGVAWASC